MLIQTQDKIVQIPKKIILYNTSPTTLNFDSQNTNVFTGVDAVMLVIKKVPDIIKYNKLLFYLLSFCLL